MTPWGLIILIMTNHNWKTAITKHFSTHMARALFVIYILEKYINFITQQI